MGTADTFWLELPASLRHLNVLNAVLDAIFERTEPSVSGPVLAQIQLAVQEVCANIVRHAYLGEPGRLALEIRLLERPARLIIETEDNGISFNPGAVAPPQSDRLPDGGYGLYLARQALDELTYVAGDGQVWQCANKGPWERLPDVRRPSLTGNRWRLLKYLEPVRPAATHLAVPSEIES